MVRAVEEAEHEAAGNRPAPLTRDPDLTGARAVKSLPRERPRSPAPRARPSALRGHLGGVDLQAVDAGVGAHVQARGRAVAMPRPRTGQLVLRNGTWHARVTVARAGETDGEVHVQTDGRLERVVDDLVHVAGREDALCAGPQHPRGRRRRPARPRSARRRSTVSTPGGAPVVVQPAALTGHPGQQPHLVAGAGAQPVVPAGGGVVADEVRPAAAVGGDGAGQADEARRRWWGARRRGTAGAGRRAGRRRSGRRCVMGTGAVARQVCGGCARLRTGDARRWGGAGHGSGYSTQPERRQLPRAAPSGTRGGGSGGARRHATCGQEHRFITVRCQLAVTLMSDAECSPHPVDLRGERFVPAPSRADGGANVPIAPVVRP